MSRFVCKPCNYMMEQKHYDEPITHCDDCGEPIFELPKIKTEAVSVKSDKAFVSPFGYIVTADGTIYSLIKQYTHGVLLAILFPEKAKEMGYVPPDEDYDVFYYQRFELDTHDDLPVIRVAFGMLHSFAVSYGKECPTTKEQDQAMVKIFREKNIKMRDEIHTDKGDCTAGAFMKELRRRK